MTSIAAPPRQNSYSSSASPQQYGSSSSPASSSSPQPHHHQSRTHTASSNLAASPQTGYDEDGDEGDGDGEDEDEDEAGDHEHDHPYEMINEQSIKSGYLWKKGEKRKTWKKRWFVLRSSKLCYYKNDKEYQLLRYIDMSDVRTVAAIELKRQDNTFGIVTSKRAYYVKASTHAESQDWIRALNEVKTQLSQRNTLTADLDSMHMTPSETVTSSTPPHQVGRMPSQVTRSPSQMSQRAYSQAAAQRAASAAAAATGPSGPPISINIPGSGTYTSPAQPRAISNSRKSGETVFSPLTATTDSETGAEAYGMSYTSSAGFSLGSSPGRDAFSAAAAQQSGSELSDASRRRTSRNGTKRSISGGRDVSAGSSGGEAMTPGVGTAVLSSSDEDDEADEELDQATPLPSLGGGPGHVGTGGAQVHDVASLQSPISPATMSPTTAAVGNTGKSISDPDRILIQGYLMKQSSRRNQWRKRWFVLSASKLMYMRSHMDSKPHREILLTSILDAIEHTQKRSLAGPSSAVVGSPTASGFSQNSFGEGGNNARTDSTVSGINANPAEAGSGPSKPENTRRHSVVAAAAGVASNLGAGVVNGLDREASGRNKRMDHSFKIITPKRTFLLCAPSEEEEIKWLSALQALLTRTRGNKAGPQRGSSGNPGSDTAQRGTGAGVGPASAAGTSSQQAPGGGQPNSTAAAGGVTSPTA